MKIARKFILITIITLAVILGINFYWGYFITLPGFSKMESSEIKEQIQTTRSLVDDEANTLSVLVRDWGTWNDTYKFIKDLNKEYIKSNLTDDTLVNAKLRFIAYLDTEGKLIYVKSINAEGVGENTLPQGMERYLGPNKKLNQVINPEDEAKGVILLPDEALVIAAKPILTSDGDGPIRGTIMMAKPLDNNMVSGWSQLIHKELSISLINANSSETEKKYVNELARQEFLTLAQGNNTMTGLFLLNDIEKTPVILARVVLERDEILEGQKMINSFTMIASLLAVFAGVVIIITMRSMLVVPLSNITSDLDDIAKKTDFSGRVRVQGKDELTDLARDINFTLETLGSSQSNLQLANFSVDSAYDNIFWITKEGKFKYVNRSACSHLGYTREEMLSMNLSDIDPIFSGPDVWNKHWEEMRQKKHLVIETKHKKKDGTLVSMEISVNYVNFQGEEYDFAFGRDISEREQSQNLIRVANAKLEKTNEDLKTLFFEEKLLEEELKKEKVKQEQIITSMGEGLLVMDKDMRIVLINPAAEKLLQVKSKDAIGQLLTEFVKPLVNNNEVPVPERPCIKAMREERTVNISLDDDLYFLIRSGKKFPVEVIATPLYEKGQVTGVVMVYKDISEEKETKIVIEETVKLRTKQLKEEQLRSQSILDNSSEGVVLTDDRGIVKYVNPAFTELFGYSRQDIQGKDYSEFIKAFDIKGNRLPPAQISDAATITSRVTLKRYYEKKNGEKLAVTVNAAPVVVEGKFTGVVRMVQNYTTELSIQQQKDDFFSIASHELRTPLTVISGNLDIILAGYGKSKITPDDKKMLNDSMLAADRLMKMISDYLNVSRLDQGRLKIDIQDLDACKIAENVVNELKSLTSEKGLSLNYVCAKGNPKIKADEGLYKEILINLIGNAVKFTEEGGISIEQSINQKMLVTRVTDTGMGIPQDKQKLLFQRFQQINDRTLNRVAGGTGLGLYISREFARQMGGDLLLIKSEPNKGSVFEILLPLSGAD